MQTNPYEMVAAERAARSDPQLVARVQAIETILPTLATRAQLEQLRGEMKEGFGSIRTEMKEGIGAVRSEIKEAIGAVRTEMKEAIGAVRAELKEEAGALRADMKEGFGELRAELQKTNGELRADLLKAHGDLSSEVHRTVISAMKWTVGVAGSLAMLAATLIAAFMPLLTSHLHG